MKQYGTPTPKQLEKINLLAKRPLSAEDVFVFAGKAIGDGLIPTRYMRVHKSLMEAFKVDALKGVSLMLDHAWANFGILAQAYGRTFDAVIRRTMDESETDEVNALFLDHYIVRNREKSGIATDQLIADIEDGVLFDTSIGFGNSKYECSICGGDYMDSSKCEHYRGSEYDGKTCSIILKPPGYLMENSLVFDGAYPGAGVLSAMSARDIENTFDTVEDIKGLEQGTKLIHTFSLRGGINTFAVRAPIKGIVVPDISLSIAESAPRKEDDTTVDLQTEVFTKISEMIGLTPEQATDATVEQVMTALSEKYSEQFTAEIIASAVPAEPQEDTLSVMDPADIRRALGITEEEVPEGWQARVVSLAQEGREARQDLIQEALDWGVRASGNGFAIESFREILSEPGRTIKAIKEMREQFKREAAEKLAPGRVTQIPVAEESLKRKAPAEAFKISK